LADESQTISLYPGLRRNEEGEAYEERIFSNRRINDRYPETPQTALTPEKNWGEDPKKKRATSRSVKKKDHNEFAEADY